MTALADELERLGQALALNEGFQLVVLECHDLESWDLYRLFDVVQVRVAELRGVPPLVLIYDPYLTTNETGSLRDQAWVEGVLGPLLELPTPKVDGASLVAVIDGTRFATTDGDELPSWTYLFHRLNERRNELARTLNGTLALALPSPLLGLFLDEAPDSASIRSGHFHLHRGLLPPTAPPINLPTPSEYDYASIYDATLRRQATDPNRAPTERTWANKQLAVRRLEPTRTTRDLRESPESQDTDRHEALAQLLLSLFSTDELRRFLWYQPGGDSLASQIPDLNFSPAALTHAVVMTLDRHGLLHDRQFWDRMLEERPLRRAEIERVRATFQPVSLPLLGVRQTHPTHTDERTVLLLPIDSESRVLLERGFPALSRALRRIHAPVRLALAEAHEPRQLREVLLRNRPQFVILRAYHPIAPDTHTYLFRLLMTLWDWPQCLIIIAPLANTLARALHGTVEQIVGLDPRLSEAYIDEFLAAFLTSNALGRPITAAFETANELATLRLPAGDDQEGPLLALRQHSSPAELHRP